MNVSLLRKVIFTINKEEFGIKNKFRYANQFSIGKPEVLKLFSNIPFLNGGLFDCLDKDNEETGNMSMLMGLAAIKIKELMFPIILFFGSERTEDLTKEYGYT